jgi:hypothetical protein
MAQQLESKTAGIEQQLVEYEQQIEVCVAHPRHLLTYGIC